MTKWHGAFEKGGTDAAGAVLTQAWAEVVAPYTDEARKGAQRLVVLADEDAAALDGVVRAFHAAQTAAPELSLEDPDILWFGSQDEQLPNAGWLRQEDSLRDHPRKAARWACEQPAGKGIPVRWRALRCPPPTAPWGGPSRRPLPPRQVADAPTDLLVPELCAHPASFRLFSSYLFQREDARDFLQRPNTPVVLWLHQSQWLDSAGQAVVAEMWERATAWSRPLLLIATVRCRPATPECWPKPWAEWADEDGARLHWLAISESKVTVPDITALQPDQARVLAWASRLGPAFPLPVLQRIAAQIAVSEQPVESLLTDGLAQPGAWLQQHTDLQYRFVDDAHHQAARACFDAHYAGDDALLLEALHGWLTEQVNSVFDEQGQARDRWYRQFDFGSVPLFDTDRDARDEEPDGTLLALGNDDRYEVLRAAAAHLGVPAGTSTAADAAATPNETAAWVRACVLLAHEAVRARAWPAVRAVLGWLSEVDWQALDTVIVSPDMRDELARCAEYLAEDRLTMQLSEDAVARARSEAQTSVDGVLTRLLEWARRLELAGDGAAVDARLAAVHERLQAATDITAAQRAVIEFRLGLRCMHRGLRAQGQTLLSYALHAHTELWLDYVVAGENGQKSGKDGAWRLEVLAAIHRELEDPQRQLHALRLRRRAAASVHGDGGPVVLERLEPEMVEALDRLGEYGEAQTLRGAQLARLRESLEDPQARRLDVRTDQALIDDLDTCADLLEQSHYPAEALSLRRRAVRLATRCLYRGHPYFEYLILACARALHAAGDWPNARQATRSVLLLKQARLGAAHPFIIDVWALLARIQADSGELKGAAESIQMCRKLTQDCVGLTPERHAKSLRAQAEVLARLGDVPGARTCASELTELQTQCFGQAHLATADVYRLFAEIEPETRQALVWLQRELGLRELLQGSEHLDVANVLLAMARRDPRCCDLADLRRAAAIFGRALPEWHRDRLEAQQCLGTWLLGNRRAAEAEPVLAAALEGARDAHAEREWRWRLTSILAECLRSLDRPAEAIDRYREMLDALPEDSAYWRALALSAWGWMLLADEALEPALERLSAAEAVLAPWPELYPDLQIAIQRDLGLTLSYLGRFGEALQRLHRARELVTTHADLNFALHGAILTGICVAHHGLGQWVEALRAGLRAEHLLDSGWPPNRQVLLKLLRTLLSMVETDKDQTEAERLRARILATENELREDEPAPPRRGRRRKKRAGEAPE